MTLDLSIKKSRPDPAEYSNNSNVMHAIHGINQPVSTVTVSRVPQPPLISIARSNQLPQNLTYVNREPPNHYLHHQSQVSYI